MSIGLRALALVGLLAALGPGCGRGAEHHAQRAQDEAQPIRPPCPARAAAPFLLPGIMERERTLAYWLERTPALDEVLMNEQQIAAHDDALAQPQGPDGKPLAWTDLTAPIDPVALATELEERLGMMRDKMERGEYVDPHGGRVDARGLAPFRVPEPLPPVEPRLHVALANVQLRCGPRTEALYKLPIDATYNRNNCSTVRAQEPVRVLMEWPNGTRLVRTRHALGWIEHGAPLSPPVPEALVPAIAAPPVAMLVANATLVAAGGARAELPAGTYLPSIAGAAHRFRFATSAGWHESTPIGAALIRSTRRALTRRAVLEAAFALLDTPYGWGGERGGRDCSGFVLDVFSSFAVQLPRDSGRQALAGTDGIAVDPATSEHQRLVLIDEAARRGVVLLHFPGHIMLYLGRNESGTPMAIHAFAEYLEPCPGGGETLRTVDRVTVSDLSLGRGTTRRSFVERITRIVVLGRPGEI